MSVSIRIDEVIYDAAKKVAHSEHRSISGQIEFWAKVGKCAIDNPDLPIGFLIDLLISKEQDHSLAEPFE